MSGWRARLGFLVPPGNPTVETEMIALAPQGVTVHFTRLVAHGATGSHAGQEERNQTMVAHMAESAALLAMVQPDVIMLSHTATSYTLGPQKEAELIARLSEQCGTLVETAFASVLEALRVLGVRKIALGTPYGEETTLKGKALLEQHGFAVVSHGRLDGVTNIYDETPERAYRLGRAIDKDEVEAVFLSGSGMPTISILETLERDLGKPAISAASAMMWRALQLARVRAPIEGYGRLLASAGSLSPLAGRGSG
jgi:maleate cis-trans isomerase